MELLQPSFLILLNAFLNAYVIVAIILLLFTLIKKPYSIESYNLLFVYNTIIPWVSLIGWIYLAVELFLAWYGQNPYEWYSFREGRMASGFNSFSWWLLLVLHSLTSMLFFIRFLRTSRLFILLHIILVIPFNYERVVIWITSLYRDYLPSSWSQEEKPWYYIVFEWMFCTIIFCGIYWLLNKRKKLPYPSLFLK